MIRSGTVLTQEQKEALYKSAEEQDIIETANKIVVFSIENTTTENLEYSESGQFVKDYFIKKDRNPDYIEIILPYLEELKNNNTFLKKYSVSKENMDLLIKRLKIAQHVGGKYSKKTKHKRKTRKNLRKKYKNKSRKRKLKKHKKKSKTFKK